MYRDLIIGFDGSLPGRDALALGRRLALATGARPTVVYVRSNRATAPAIPAVAPEWSWGTGVAQTLDEARLMLADVAGARFTTVAETAVARVLHEIAEEHAAALIVLGSTHRSPLGRVIPGTTADAVTHGAPCPVAIAPSGYERGAGARPFSRVTAAVDGGDDTERVAKVAGRIARRTGATLRLVSLVTGPSAYGSAFAADASLEEAAGAAAEEVLARAAGAAGDGELECEIGAGRVGEEVARLSGAADLLVIGSRGCGLLRRAAIAGQTGDILAAATCPVLVVPGRLSGDLDEAAVAFGAATPPLSATGAE